jgi:hypothetical protein
MAMVTFAIGALAYRHVTPPDGLVRIPNVLWATGGIIALGMLIWAAREKTTADRSQGGLVAVPFSILASAVGYVLLLAVTVGPLHVMLQQSVRCKYDLATIKSAMDFLASNSQAESVVFTDDWDIFPVFFYYNHHNHYIVGLDPKFSHESDPVLWERYVRLSRGRFPARTTVETVDASGKPVRQAIHVTLDDIVNEFGCRYVITDRQHSRLAVLLERVPERAPRIWPVDETFDWHSPPPYKIFLMLDEPASPQESASE